MGSKKKTTQTTNQTQTAAPPSYTLPGMTDIAGKITDALDFYPREGYGGNFIAIPDQGRTDNIINSYDNAAQQAASQGQATQDFTQNFLAAPQDSPELLQGAIDSAIHPVFRALTEQVLPQLGSSAVSSGAYGNNRAFNLLPQQVTRDANENAQRIAASMGYQHFNDARDREIARAGLVPSLNNSIMQMFASQGDLLRQGSSEDLAARQAVIDNALAKDQYDTYQPFRGLDQATELMSRLSSGYGTNTLNGTTTTVQKTGGLGSVVSGLAGLGGLAMSAFSPGGPFAAAAAGAPAAAARAATPAAAAFAPTSFYRNG